MAVTRDRSPLLNLPEALLREVVSWSPDGATANALLAACRVTHQQRRDPATAALLLLRCPCRNYMSALISCAKTCGGAAAVVQQVLQLTGAGTDSGGPLAAPPPLMQAVLLAAVVNGDPHTIRALLASRQPPDVDGDGGAAAVMAVQHCKQTGRHEALQALLECGADPCAGDLQLLAHAAIAPSALPALRLLVQLCPAGRRSAAIVRATSTAVGSGNVGALEDMLGLPGIATMEWPLSLVVQAVHVGVPRALQLVIERTVCPQADLASGLLLAAERGNRACAALLLDRGAGADGGVQFALLSAFTRPFQRWQPAGEVGEVPPAEAALRDVVRLLLQRGAAATPGVRAAAEGAGHGGMLATVVREVEAAGADP